MKIERNYYTELKEDMRECAAECADVLQPHTPDLNASVFEPLFRTGRFDRLKDIAGGKALSESAFRRLSDQALDMAERIGLNVIVETEGLNGTITFRAAWLSLNTHHDQLHISRLFTLLSSADHFRFDVVPSDDEMLLQISLHYTLSLGVISFEK